MEDLVAFIRSWAEDMRRSDEEHMAERRELFSVMTDRIAAKIDKVEDTYNKHFGSSPESQKTPPLDEEKKQTKELEYEEKEKLETDLEPLVGEIEINETAMAETIPPGRRKNKKRKKKTTMKRLEDVNSPINDDHIGKEKKIIKEKELVTEAQVETVVLKHIVADKEDNPLEDKVHRSPTNKEVFRKAAPNYSRLQMPQKSQPRLKTKLDLAIVVRSKVLTKLPKSNKNRDLPTEEIVFYNIQDEFLNQYSQFLIKRNCLLGYC